MVASWAGDACQAIARSWAMRWGELRPPAVTERQDCYHFGALSIPASRNVAWVVRSKMPLKIAIDRKQSEFEIQADALRLLAETLGPDYIVRGEYTYRGCRFDIAIFRADTRDLVCTIEVKKDCSKGWTRKRSTIRQTTKYQRATGRPCIALNEATMHSAIALLKKRLAVSA